MADVEDLLQRRTDLSTFLMHFTRERESISGRSRLLSILSGGQLLLGQPMGMAASLAAEVKGSQPAFFISQQVVCFSETPLEHAWMMCADIDARQVRLSQYGLAFTKTWGRMQGINPVWYLDISARGIDWLTNPVNRMVHKAAAADRLDDDIFKLTPFMEQMGPMRYGAQKEFWWEREWRLAGKALNFEPPDVVAIFAPANQHASLTTELEHRRRRSHKAPGFFDGLRFVDPRWGLERIIARLAGVPDEMAGSFPRRP